MSTKSPLAADAGFAAVTHVSISLGMPEGSHIETSPGSATGLLAPSFDFYCTKTFESYQIRASLPGHQATISEEESFQASDHFTLKGFSAAVAAVLPALLVGRGGDLHGHVPPEIELLEVLVVMKSCCLR